MANVDGLAFGISTISWMALAFWHTGRLHWRFGSLEYRCFGRKPPWPGKLLFMAAPHEEVLSWCGCGIERGTVNSICTTETTNATTRCQSTESQLNGSSLSIERVQFLFLRSLRLCFSLGVLSLFFVFLLFFFLLFVFRSFCAFA